VVAERFWHNSYLLLEKQKTNKTKQKTNKQTKHHQQNCFYYFQKCITVYICELTLQMFLTMSNFPKFTQGLI